MVCAAERFLAKDNQWKARQRETLASHELNRRILALVTGFRLALAAALVLVATLQPSPPLLGARYPLLFIGLICIYAVVSVVVALMLRDSGRPTVSIAWVQLIFDIVCIVLIVHSSGGSSSGIESLLVVFVISIGMTLPPLSCYLAAVLASLAIMLEQSISFMQGASTATDFITVGSSAAIMLAMSLAIRPLVRRVSETAELARQATSRA